MTRLLACLFTAGVLSILPPARAQSIGPEFNCFGVLVGKGASVDGSVMMAHNEDDGGEQFLNWYAVRRQSHIKDGTFPLRRGGRIKQPARTYKYLWLELPKMEVSDSFLNENTVAIASDGCPSREDRDDLTDGGILYELRVLAAERASSAAQAVDLMGEWIERFGYADSGRTYLIADKDEAWVLCVVRGRHWAAARIPDDQIMAIANCYVLDEVDLQDTRNYRGSKDLISYAVNRGWHDPAKDGAFSFKKAYGSPGSLVHPDNVKRQWAALSALTGKRFAIAAEALPFTAVPKPGKVSLSDLFAVLANHYEGTEADGRRNDPENKGHIGGICHDGTQYGFVAQLRAHLSADLAGVLWVAPYHPCSKLFIPWYVGMTQIPNGFSRFTSAQEAAEKHLTEGKDFRAKWPTHRYWRYLDSSDSLNSDYPRKIRKPGEFKARLQKQILDAQPAFEAKVSAMQDQEQIAKTLNGYTAEWIRREKF